MSTNISSELLAGVSPSCCTFWFHGDNFLESWLQLHLLFYFVEIESFHAFKYRNFTSPGTSWNIPKSSYKKHKHLSGNILCAQQYKKLSLGRARSRIKEKFLFKQMKMIDLMF